METVGSAARYPSPLRYPGGKGKVANFLKLLIVGNDLTGIDYVEPYAGGASVALTLLFEDYVSNAQINDLNQGVYQFWRLAVNDPDALCRRIRAARLDLDEWQRQKRIYAAADTAPEDLAFATFYLNRTNRSGIISRGGVIGGNDQSGNWKIDARFNKDSLCSRILKIARFAPRLTVTNHDAVELLEASANRSDPALHYLDPPYYLKGSRLYDNFYSHDDHLAVSSTVRSMKGPWVVSYDADPEILAMYSGSESMRYILGYSASKSPNGTEVMFFSDDLVIPDVSSPAGISSSAVDAARAPATLF
ncbi:DNA adenine methylase [Micromonospora sp. HB375]|uniref:DNA adenine methylase n=1 Tax=Micromonospora TaxID=1873 RepID=UPI001AEA424B|nr:MULTISPECIES: DNA adenine methylase [unclassified Micromonospora]MBP1785745.1 DNA adenine methylase [Micromonospora sp. HB375]MDH6470215.1 DNA adenine methylase [Micromonospora sp. H404/HB375]